MLYMYLPGTVVTYQGIYIGGCLTVRGQKFFEGTPTFIDHSHQFYAVTPILKCALLRIKLTLLLMDSKMWR